MGLYVITGASRGIGLALVRLLCDRGETVVAAVRKASEDLANLPCEVVDKVDVTDETAAHHLAQALGERSIDVLVNNAGILISDDLASLDFAQALQQYDVNALGPLRITRALLPRLTRGSKVAIVTSRVGSLADNSSGGNYGYRMSKAAANMAVVNLAIDLEPKGITVAALHPGYVRTHMTHGRGFIDAETAAQGLLDRLDALTLADTGTFWHAEGYQLPW